jgi:alpha-mannosidase
VRGKGLDNPLNPCFQAMKKHRQISEERVALWVEEKLSAEIYGRPHPLSLTMARGAFGDGKDALENGEFEAVQSGHTWGPAFSQAWFKVTGEVPSHFKGQEVVAQLSLGGELTLWEEMVPTRGVDPFHTDVPICTRARGGEPMDLLVEAIGSLPEAPHHRFALPRKEEPFVVEGAHLRTFHRDRWQLWLDAAFALDLMKAHAVESPERAHLLRALNDAANLWVGGEKNAVEKARRRLGQALEREGGEKLHTLTPLGHAHLDTAWLWPMAITKRKMLHTAANQLSLMEEYPEHRFVHSQASQYEWLERDHPALFEKIKKAVLSGNWEVVGSMWVEADANLIGSESFARQILYGIRYFQLRFKRRTRDLWIPDVFGYAASMPQLMAHAGIHAFMTQKLSWNQLNPMPHSTFLWEGIDGTRIYTHLPPAETYNGNTTPTELLRHHDRYKDHGRSDEALYLYGHGDGGGGPEAKHLEFLRRAEKSPGLPGIKRRSAEAFFKEAPKAARDLSVWSGELYFELHRGTFTSQAKTKALNRRCEERLRELDALFAFYPDVFAQGFESVLEGLWKDALLHQFHDILPGSSIAEVYEDTEAELSRILDEANSEIARALQCIEGEGSFTHGLYGLNRGDGLMRLPLVEPLSDDDVPQSLACGAQRLPVQRIEDAAGPALIFPIPHHAKGRVAGARFNLEAPMVQKRLSAKKRRLETEKLKAEFDDGARLVSLVLKEDDVEWVKDGQVGNDLRLFDDRPLNWGAWDVDAFYAEAEHALPSPTRFEVVEEGPVRVALEWEMAFGQSRLVQRISAGLFPGLRFDTWVDWQEREKLLKVLFPWELNTTEARCEIQFGNLKRPTHENTSWDVARFEVCAHRWVELSEGHRGVALFNESKYGHSLSGSTVGLSLLRASQAPDPRADLGQHHFSYGVFPHLGTYRQAGIMDHAAAFGAPGHAVPLDLRSGGEKTPALSAVTWSADLRLESIKQACDNDDVVLRLFEMHNVRGEGFVELPFEIKNAWRCDLLEERGDKLQVLGRRIVLPHRPFEIMTVRVERRRR